MGKSFYLALQQYGQAQQVIDQSRARKMDNFIFRNAL